MATTPSKSPPKAFEEWRDHLGLYWYEDMLLLKEMEPEVQPRVKSFRFSEDDILISTYPRSGTTWTQEMTWLICNKVDLEGARSVGTEVRVPFMEYTEPHIGKPNVEILENTPSPRIIKTHYPPQFFDQIKCKTIIVMRNLKDVMVSHFHFYKDLFEFKGSWDDFFEMFKQDLMFNGSWVQHCLKCWSLRDDPNILILKYEDMKKDHSGAIKKIAKFCGKSLNDEQIVAIEEFTFFKNMKKASDASDMCKKNEKYKSFVRKGAVGGWREYFTEDQLKYVTNLLKETTEKEGLVFDD